MTNQFTYCKLRYLFFSESLLKNNSTNPRRSGMPSFCYTYCLQFWGLKYSPRWAVSNWSRTAGVTTGHSTAFACICARHPNIHRNCAPKSFSCTFGGAGVLEKDVAMFLLFEKCTYRTAVWNDVISDSRVSRGFLNTYTNIRAFSRSAHLQTRVQKRFYHPRERPMAWLEMHAAWMTSSSLKCGKTRDSDSVGIL